MTEASNAKSARQNRFWILDFAFGIYERLVVSGVVGNSVDEGRRVRLQGLPTEQRRLV